MKSSNTKKIKKVKASEEDRLENMEREGRNAFTPGWHKDSSEVEALPIKLGGKVIKTSREAPAPREEEQSEDDEDEDEDGEDVDSNRILDSAEQEFDFLEEEVQQPVVEKKAVKKSESTVVARRKIADICTTVTRDPEASIKKRKHTDDVKDPRLADLFDYFAYTNPEVVELAMLSGIIIFKDILPGYKIRSGAEIDPEQLLKKETRRLRDFETALLTAYQRFLKFLDSKIQGLGNPKKGVTEWNPASLLGLSALRGVCELLRAIPHFNFRAVLLKQVVTRAAQPCERVSQLCCDSLRTAFTNDIEGELTYEAVRMIAKVADENKYCIPDSLIRVLEHAKVRVHADDAKDIRRKAKQERRKRKRQGDDVEAGLLEAKGAHETHVQRFQADALHELSLIYFRIIKRKIGFALLPAALAGLGRITHLINIDTVEDLISVMRSLLEETNPPPPLEVQAHCIYCVFRTLSGPGQELSVDDEIFVSTLCSIILDANASFDNWDLVLECVEYCLVKKHETRGHYSKNIVRLLLLACPMLNARAAGTALALLQTILLRYPQIKADMSMLAPGGPKAELVDVAEDLAMVGLKVDSKSKSVMIGQHIDLDGSWSMALLKYHYDARVRRVATVLMGTDAVPTPYRSGDAKEDYSKAEDWFRTLNKNRPSSQGRPTGPASGSNSSSAGAGAGAGAGAEVPAKKVSKRGFGGRGGKAKYDKAKGSREGGAQSV